MPTKQFLNIFLLLVVIPFISYFGFNLDLNIYAGYNGISISKMLEKYENGDLEYCRENIDKLSIKYKNNSNILYLKGLITVDGKKSVEQFKKIVDKFKTSSKKNIAKKKIKDYNNLEKYLLLKGTTKGNIAKNTIQISENITNNKKSGKRKRVKIKQNKFDTIELKKYRYTVQLGVFSNLTNANNLKDKYSYLDTFIKTDRIDDTILNRVLSGKYKTKKEALKRADFLMQRYDLKTLIKELE